MEVIRKILQALGRLQQKRAEADIDADDQLLGNREFQSEAPGCSWADLTGFVDGFDQNPNSSEHEVLLKIMTAGRTSSEKLLELFLNLAKSSDWQPLLGFADIPVDYDNATLDAAMKDYSRVDSIEEQTRAIPEIFSNASPTSLELLTMFLDGDSERYPEATCMSIKYLLDREKTAKVQLATLLSNPWTDQIRWWLVKSTNNLSPAARNFIQSIVKGRKDQRLEAMALIILLKFGLEWAIRHPAAIDKSVADVFYTREYSEKLDNLIALLPA